MITPEDQPQTQPIIDYLGHSPTRPKQEICQAMAALGFRVPTIYETLEDALRSKNDFVARSEGPDELYHSGLKVSINTRSRYYNEVELRAYAAKLDDPERTYESLTADRTALGARGIVLADQWYSYVKEARGVKGSNLWRDDNFARQHALSYWRAVEGDNFYVAGDTMKPGRYYIGRLTRGRQSFTVVDGKQVLHEDDFFSGSSAGVPDIDRLVGFYTDVTQTPLVGGNSECIIEMSDPGDGKYPYLLQVLPAHARAIDIPDIDASQRDILYVRGGTPLEGVRGMLRRDTYESLRDYMRDPNRPVLLTPSVLEGKAVQEYMLPRAAVAISGAASESYAADAFLLTVGINSLDHGWRSTFLKPNLSLALSERAYEVLYNLQRKNRYHLPELYIRAGNGRAEVYAETDSDRIPLHDVGAA